MNAAHSLHAPLAFEKALELITMQIPFFKNQPSTVNLTAEGTTGSLGIGLGFCFAMNQNTYAFSIFPALPLAGKNCPHCIADTLLI